MKQRFSVATFKRVFDTAPAPDLVTLDELIYGLTHFLNKNKLAASLKKSEQQISDAVASLERGETVLPKNTRVGRQLLGAYKARGLGGAKALASALQDKITGRAKTDLRLWSPADYTPNQKRGADAVRSISCLVLDFDGGTDPHEARQFLKPHFVITHSTWSHSPELPKFRLCLPLAQPVHAADFRAVWDFANQRVKSTCDQALKSPGSTFALPACAERTSAFAFVREGLLFDPVRDGLARPAPKVISTPAAKSHFRNTDGEKRVAVGDWEKGARESWEADFEELFENTTPANEVENSESPDPHAHGGSHGFDDDDFDLF